MRVKDMPMTSEEETKGKAYVHCTAWKEAYRGLLSQSYLDGRTLGSSEKNALSAFHAGVSTLLAKYELHVSMGDGTRILAGGGVTIAAKGDAHQHSQTSADSAGFVGKADIKSILTVDRTVTTRGATASLTAGRDNSFQNVIAAGATGTTPAASARIASTGTYADPDGVTCTGSIAGGILTGGTYDGKIGTITLYLADGTVFVLPLPTRDGYRFLYWLGSIYYAGDAYDVTAGHVFTAVWEQIVNPTPGPIPDPTPGPTSVRPDNGGNLVPQAGDATSAGSMATMALIGLALMAASLVVSSRRRERV